MPVPKKKTSKAKRDMRRAHHKMSLKFLPSLVECPNCHEIVMSHRVCLNCGYYRGRKVLELKEEEEE